MEFDFDYIIENYLEYEDHLKQFQDQTVVVLLGPTGCGKSSLINYLLGAKMTKKQRKVIPVNPYEEKSKIGHGINSETYVPDIYKSQTHTYCDCPGFKDNRSFNDKICVGINTQTMLKLVKEIPCFVICIEEAAFLNERAKGLKKLLEILLTFFQHDQSLKSCIWIITKTNEFKSIEDLVEEILSLLSYFEKEKKDEENQKIINILNILIENSDKIILGNILDDGQTRKQIESRIFAIKKNIQKEHLNILTYDKNLMKFIDMVIQKARLYYGKCRSYLEELQEREQITSEIKTLKENVEIYKEKCNELNNQEEEKVQLQVIQGLWNELNGEKERLNRKIERIDEKIQIIVNENKELESDEVVLFKKISRTRKSLFGQLKSFFSIFREEIDYQGPPIFRFEFHYEQDIIDNVEDLKKICHKNKIKKMEKLIF